MIFLLVLLVTMINLSSTIDIERIQAFQEPLKSLDPDRYGGYWFTQGRYIPCSWGGSKTFTNYVYNVQPRGDAYTTTSYWRQGGVCTDVVSFTPLKAPGIFRQKDPIGTAFLTQGLLIDPICPLSGLENYQKLKGNVYSGEWYILETDYKTYSVSSGCTKPSVTGDKCADPYISADTRHPHPNRHILAKINRILKMRFGLSLNDLVPVSHKDPCVKAPPSPKPKYSHLSKKY